MTRVRLATRAACVLLLVFMAGCAAQSHQQITSFARSTQDLQIVLMAPDVELGELSAGGVTEPKPDWTQLAHANMAVALRAAAGARHLSLADFKPDAGGAELSERNEQLVKLHRAVGRAILQHQYMPVAALPTKQGRFDWSLGPESGSIRTTQGADYALFIYVRDTYTSAGRAALIVAAALFGVGVQGGVQLGFASLVDLRSGDIVWFNRLARAAGDLRTPEGATETVNLLLSNFPT